MRTTFTQWAARIVNRAAALPQRTREAYLVEEISDALNDAFRAGASLNITPLRETDDGQDRASTR